MPVRNIITITTDFGVRDHFVGAMKGVILTINPEANLLDVSHDVASFSVVDGAFTIAQAYRYFPADTVHLVIIDPGVGGERRPLLVEAGRHFFVGPDNGVFSFIYEREERVTVRHITASHYFLQPVSRTFHGRDIFSPIAAWLTKGIEPVQVRRPDQRLPAHRQPEPDHRERSTRARHGAQGRQVRQPGHQLFAGALSAVRRSRSRRRSASKSKDSSSARLRKTFSEGAPGEVFAIVGSSGYLEIVCNGDAASRALNASSGDEIVLTFQ